LTNETDPVWSADKPSYATTNITQEAPSGTGSLVYSNGQFYFTPPSSAGLGSVTNVNLNIVAGSGITVNSGSSALLTNNGTLTIATAEAIPPSTTDILYNDFSSGFGSWASYNIGGVTTLVTNGVAVLYHNTAALAQVQMWYTNLTTLGVATNAPWHMYCLVKYHNKVGALGYTAFLLGAAANTNAVHYLAALSTAPGTALQLRAASTLSGTGDWSSWGLAGPTGYTPTTHALYTYGFGDGVWMGMDYDGTNTIRLFQAFSVNGMKPLWQKYAQGTNVAVNLTHATFGTYNTALQYTNAVTIIDHLSIGTGLLQ
jgi:hypothetical protein